MNDTEASEMASVLADDISETLSACLPAEPTGGVHLTLDRSGVVLPAAARVLDHFCRLVALPYTAPRPNDFQSKGSARRPAPIALSGGAEPVAMRLWTEMREQRPWLGYELIAEQGVGLALGGFHL